MDAFFIWLETSALSVWVRESQTVFAFPTILSFHTLGMGMVAGLSAAIDLRILGFAPKVPLTQTKRYYPWLWLGFWLNAASGVVLLVGYPTKALTNPVFYGKLACVGLGVAVQMLIRRRVLYEGASDTEPVPARGRMLAAASLVLWAAAITSGRFLAYTYVKLTTI